MYCRAMEEIQYYPLKSDEDVNELSRIYFRHTELVRNMRKRKAKDAVNLDY